MFWIETQVNKIIQNIFRSNIVGNENEMEYWDRLWSKYIKTFQNKMLHIDIEDEWWSNSYEEMHSQYRNLLGGFENKNICELGCGSGYSSLLMCQEGANVTMVDFSPNAKLYNSLLIDYMGLNKEKASFVLADAYSKDLKIGDHDLVWNCGVVEHYEWENAVELITIMMTHAKAGGKVMVTIPNEISPQITYLNAVKGKGSEIYYSYRMLKKAMTEAGLEDVQVVPLNYWVPSLFPHSFARYMRKWNVCRYFNNLAWLFTGIGTKK